jgi:AsmA protein
MNKILKWLLAGLGIVAVLLVAAAVVLPMVIDPNNYKEEISAAVLKKTGRDLVIGGEIKWTVFPSVGLELSDVKLGNRTGFGDQPMLDIGQVGISVKLVPLFSRKIEVGEVSMADVSINLQRNADGQNNWEDLSQKRSAATDTPSQGGTDIDTFVISGIEISNANVSLKDMGETTELKELDLIASDIELGRPFALEGSFSVNMPKHQLNGQVAFDGRFQSSANGLRYGIKDLELSFKGNHGAAGEAVSLDATVNTNADINLESDQATLSDFVLQLHDLSAKGDFRVTSITSTPQFEGQLSVAQFNPKSFMQALGLEVPSTGNDKALTRLEAEMNVTGSASGANMQNLKIRFDESTFQGKLELENFDQPNLAFDFQVDKLNLDDYMPKTEATPGSGQASVESDFLVDDFRGFTGGGDFRIGELIVAGLKATEVSTTMSSNGKGVRFFPVNASFYGGKHEGEIKIDASGARPMLSVNQGITGVQAKELLQDLSGTARLTGTGDFFLQIETDFSNSETIFKALSGDIGMSILDGAIIGIDVADTINMVKSALGKQTEVVGESGQDKKTEFAELSMTGVFNRGILTSDDLLMQSTLLRMTGQGKFNLVDETIDYVLKPVLLGDQIDKSLGKLSGSPIPIKLTGNLYEPDIKVDIVSAIAGSQKELINQKKNELIDGLLGGKDDSGGGNNEDDSGQKNDPVKSLLDGVLGGKKKKDKQKEDDGSGY